MGPVSRAVRCSNAFEFLSDFDPHNKHNQSVRKHCIERLHQFKHHTYILIQCIYCIYNRWGYLGTERKETQPTGAVAPSIYEVPHTRTRSRVDARFETGGPE